MGVVSNYYFSAVSMFAMCIVITLVTERLIEPRLGKFDPTDADPDAIEEELAHLERAMAQISDVVARQQKELDRALDRNQRLMDKLAALESDVGTSATAHEKPPHY